MDIALWPVDVAPSCCWLPRRPSLGLVVIIEDPPRAESSSSCLNGVVLHLFGNVRLQGVHRDRRGSPYPKTLRSLHEALDESQG